MAAPKLGRGRDRGVASKYTGGTPRAAQSAPGIPYRDVMVQRFAIHPFIFCSDVQEINLTARHHDANQGPVLSSCSLQTVHPRI
jgi:hypothetical protein